MSDWAKSKSKKDLENKELGKMSENFGNFLGGLLGDINAKSAYTQILIGAGAGWLTGFSTMKVGKMAAFAIGGTIILVEIAHLEGYITIDWNKMCKKIDKVESAVCGGSDTSWIDKAEKFVDRKIDRAEDILKRESKKAKKWYSKLIGDENGPKINDFHIFVTAFIGGIALGVACS